MWKLILVSIFFIIIKFSASDFTSWEVGTYVPNSCVCAPVGQCSYAGETPNVDGSGIIEARIVTNGENPKGNLGTNETICRPVSTGIPLVANSITDCADGLEACCPSIGYSCGIRYPPIMGSPVPRGNQAAYGAYPYQAVILTPFNLYLASGVLIDQFHVLTVAHKVYNLSSYIKVRLGDWDASDNYEPFEAIERNATIHVHPNFTLASLRNNIAILRLNSMVPLGQYPTIATVCLPNSILSNLDCWVSGWGKNETGSKGRYQRIVKEVDVPLVDQSTCLKLLRLTRLGKYFLLDNFSFVCAGGEVGKDACTGDGGAPLSCYVGDRFYLYGLVAWGIECGASKVPGVYVNIFSYIPWIRNMTRTLSAQSSMATTQRVTSLASTSSTSRSTTVTVKKLITTTRNIGTTARMTTLTSRRTSVVSTRTSTRNLSGRSTTRAAVKKFQAPIAP